MKMTIFWVVAPCNPVQVSVSEVLAASIIRAVNWYQITRRNNPEDSHLRQIRGLLQNIRSFQNPHKC
jgi:hypothetical protein